jgi:hypothetical protein
MRDAQAMIFVMAESPDQAQVLAQAYVTHYGWLPGAVETIVQPTDHAVAQLEPDIGSAALQARSHGVAGMFVTVPKVEGHPDTPATYQSLLPPSGGSNSVN